MTLKLGTRGSQLALWQAHHVADRIRAIEGAPDVEIIVIKTTGDAIVDRPLAEIGGKGLFIKELEHALIVGDIDFAVHSLKDMPTEAPEGLELSCYPGRMSPFDALCAADPITTIADLPASPTIATGSLRRQWQVRGMRADAKLVGIRGNVPTRLARRYAEDDPADAVVLAAAGLHRLELWDAERFIELRPPDVIPAPGQGTLCIETRVGDTATRAFLDPLDDANARLTAYAERSCLAVVEGDCHTPFGAFAVRAGDQMTLCARLYDDDGVASDAEETARVVSEQDAVELGRRVAERLTP